MRCLLAADAQRDVALQSEAAVGIGIAPEVAAERCRRSMRIGFVHLSDESSERRTICVRRLRSLPLLGPAGLSDVRA